MLIFIEKEKRNKRADSPNQRKTPKLSQTTRKATRRTNRCELYYRFAGKQLLSQRWLSENASDPDGQKPDMGVGEMCLTVLAQNGSSPLPSSSSSCSEMFLWSIHEKTISGKCMRTENEHHELHTGSSYFMTLLI